MRWPWQRVAADDGGQARGSGGGAEAPSAASAAPGDPGPGGPASTSYSPAGWAFLPPVQRQIADAPPATLRAEWVDALPTRVIPSRVAELTHVVDSAAPAGTVAAAASELGAPVQRAAVADLTLRPPQTAAEQARERRAVVQRQAGSGTPARSVAPSAAPTHETADAGPSVDTATREVQASEGSVAELPLSEAALAEPASSDPAIAEVPITAERMPVADAPEPANSGTANADASPAPAAPDLALPSVQRMPAADAGASMPTSPDQTLPAEDPSAASAPLEVAETSTIAASPPVHDPGRFGLAAPLPRPSESPAATPAMPTRSPIPVQRATGAPEPSGRRMGLGAPLPGGRAEISAPGPGPARGSEVGSAPDVAVPGSAAEDASMSIPSTSAVQREAAAAPGAAVSPNPTADSAAPSVDGGEPGGAAASDGGTRAIEAVAERPAGLGAGVGGPDPGPTAGSPAGWTVPVGLALQRTRSGVEGDAAVGGDRVASDAVAPAEGTVVPALDPAPAPLVVPLIAQRALESSFEVIAQPRGAMRPRAVPATAVVGDQLPTPTPTPASAVAVQRHASGVQREAGPAGGPTLQRATGASGVSGASSGPNAEGVPGTATGSSGGVFGWVQRTLGLAAPRPGGATDATDGLGSTDGLDALGATDGLDALGATAAIDDATGVDRTQAAGDDETRPASAAAASLARPATPPGFGAPPLAVSRLAASDAAAPAPGLARTPLATAAPGALRHPGATPVAVQRASQTIEAPPAASVSRMVLPVVPTAPAHRSDGGFDGPPDGASWSGGSSAGGPVVQTAVDPGSTPPAEPPGESASAPAAGGAAAAAGGGAGAGGIDTSPAGLETLAARLYGPLARRLKAELLLDRERRGIRIDGI
ncbi:hypothetical protein [Agromyces aureus]|uniref:Uncharacterized protein n=1 Tax=Agromyces aureus TaxID=453304 RepID=A0A191WBU2_9MICO|nr:hypothetical protein [Agromyces aureus]ANJ25707.1 hypothetical protein ATC03_01945 [Agromyces aureus]